MQSHSARMRCIALPDSADRHQRLLVSADPGQNIHATPLLVLIGKVQEVPLPSLVVQQTRVFTE
jgi:hypothetical protein